MDNDVILSQFDDIDEKVEYLLELCTNLKAANARLKSRIEIMEKEIRAKSEAEVSYSEKKEMVRKKIAHLINKLDHFSDVPAS